MTNANNIALRQNEPEFLELQAAKNWLYDQARSAARTQVWTAVVAPLALAGMKAIDPELSSWAAVYAVIALGLEPELDAWQERLRGHAALVQELFDRKLFQLPWPKGAIGTEPSIEELKRWSRHYRSRAADWKDWYPPDVATLPLSVARVACQRTNGWWDSVLREHYATGLSWVGFGVVAVVFVVGAVRQQTVLEMATLATILAPVLRWLLRTTRRQRSSASVRRRLFEWAERLCREWQAVEISEQALAAQSAEIQRETYEQRRTGPLVPSWLYFQSRVENEESVRAATADLCSEGQPRSRA